MSRTAGDGMEFYREHVRCCACCGSIRMSRYVNLVAMGRRATWKYPVAANVLTGRDGEAVAVVCDGCIDSKREIRWAIETEGDRVTYHLLKDLERLPPEPTYRLVRTPGHDAVPEIVGIQCLFCGLTSWHPEDVRELYCGHCHVFHERVESDHENLKHETEGRSP